MDQRVPTWGGSCTLQFTKIYFVGFFFASSLGVLVTLFLRSFSHLVQASILFGLACFFYASFAVLSCAEFAKIYLVGYFVTSSLGQLVLFAFEGRGAVLQAGILFSLSFLLYLGFSLYARMTHTPDDADEMTLAEETIESASML
jgi:hypothetical protein